MTVCPIKMPTQGSSNEEVWGVLSFDQKNLDSSQQNTSESKEGEEQTNKNSPVTLYVPSGLTESQKADLRKATTQNDLYKKKASQKDIKLIVLPDVFKTSSQPSREDKPTIAGPSPQDIVMTVLKWIKGMKTNPKEKEALFSFLQEKYLGRTFLECCLAYGGVSILASGVCSPLVYNSLIANLNQFGQILTLSRPLDIITFVGVALMLLIGVSLIFFSLYQMKAGANQVDSYLPSGNQSHLRSATLLFDLEATFGYSKSQEISAPTNENYLGYGTLNQ